MMSFEMVCSCLSNSEGQNLGPGLLPLLCNVQLAAEVIMQLREDGDDSGVPHVFLASDYFYDILTSKLLLNSIHAY